MKTFRECRKFKISIHERFKNMGHGLLGPAIGRSMPTIGTVGPLSADDRPIEMSIGHHLAECDPIIARHSVECE